MKTKNIIKKIFNLFSCKNLKIIEIGPGDGRLTERVLYYEPKEFKIIEIDPDLIPILKLKFSKNQNIKIINENILNYQLTADFTDNRHSCIVQCFRNVRHHL